MQAMKEKYAYTAMFKGNTWHVWHVGDGYKAICHDTSRVVYAKSLTALRVKICML